MSNIKNRKKIEHFDSMIWKKTKMDHKNRVVLPKKLRKKLGLNSHSFVLWISAKNKPDHDNEFLVEIGVKR